jgi:hypothetical protein
MSHTRSDLVHEALRLIGFLPQGQTAGAEEYATLDASIDDMIAELEWRNVVFIAEPGLLGDANSGAFEGQHFHSLAAILANMVKAAFGLAGDQGLLLDATKAESDLYTMEAQPYTRQIAPGQYY